MNSKIREDLTGLLADHLCNEIGGAPQNCTWGEVAEAAMDFIYGEPDGDVQEPEQPQVTAEGFAWFGDQGGPCGSPCRCGQSGCSWPGNLGSVEDSPVEVTAVYGVMTPSAVLRESFVYLGPLSRTEQYVPAPRSDSEPKAQ